MQIVGTPPPNRKIVRFIGSGGMGVVYEALDEQLDRRVALKVVHPHLTLQAGIRDRLLTEARLAARVEHENVVRIYSVHEVDGGLCLEMQYVDGVPLTGLLSGQPLSLCHAIDLMRQVLQALAACHDRNVIHGDLKPSNLLVTPDGRVMLADFGIARAVYGEEDEVASTAPCTSTLWGTPQYCPPEAWEGAAPSASWDLYGLGILLYEALTGVPPFSGRTPAVLIRESLEGVKSPIGAKRSDLSPEFSALLDSLVSKEPGQRPASAATALEVLEHVPEFRSDSIATKPLRHGETVTRDLSVPLSIINIPVGEHGPSGEAGRKQGIVRIFVVLGILLALLIPAFFGLHSGGGGTATDGPFGDAGKLGEVLDVTAVSGAALFSYNDGVHGRELWLADSLGEAVLVADINEGRGSSNPAGFLRGINNTVLFSALTEGQGTEPWIFKPHDNSVHILRDLVPGPISSNPNPIASWASLYFFHANPLTRPAGMWISDTNPESTGLLREINPAAAFLDSNAERHFVVEDGIYKIWNKGDEYRLTYYRFHDGGIEDLGAVGEEVGDLVALNDQIVFTMRDATHGFELWRVAGDTRTPELLKDIWPGADSSVPGNFCKWKDKVYFSARTPEEGVELWMSDGTTAGTVLVHDINPGSHDGSPTTLVATEGGLFFRASHDPDGVELCASTGVPGDPLKVYDIREGRASSVPYSIAQIGSFLCFSADDGEHGEEFWALDLNDPGAEPYLVEDIRSGATSSEPHSLKSVGANAGIFIYKSDEGVGERENLMRVMVNGNVLELLPYYGLPK